MKGLLEGDTLSAGTVVLRERTMPRTFTAYATELGLAAGMILIAVLMRGINLSGYSGDLDEGIRGIQLLLMRAGYRPFQDIYASQGPLLLDLLYPLYVVFGGTLAAVRLAVGTYSLVSLVGVYLVSRQVAGPVGAAVASLFLILSPTYLRNSRQALAETVALGPAILAIWAAIVYQRNGRRTWLVAASVLLGISLLIKPITIAAALPIGIIVLLRGGQALRRLLVVGSVVAAVVIGVSLLTGLAGVLDQVVEYRLRSRDLQNWQLAENWSVLRGALGRDQVAIFGIGALGSLALLALSPRAGLPLVMWGAATLALLLFYTPLFPKHAAIMMPPVAILAGAGLGRVWQYLHGQAQRLSGAHLGLLIPLAWYVWTLPGLLGWDLRFMNLTQGNELPRFSDAADAVSSITALSETSDFVLTDHPYLAFLAQRLVPPPLADPSKTRIRSRELTGEEIASIGEAYPSKVAVLWSERFRPLRSFRLWFEERYQVAKIYGKKGDSPRYIYIRR